MQIRVTSFLTALENANMATVITASSPRVFSYMAEQAGMKTEAFLQLIVDQTASIVQDSGMREMSVGDANINVEDYALSDSTRVVYGFIQLSFVMDTDGETVRFDSEMLVISENDEWYLFRLASLQQYTLLKTFYPFLEGVQLPPQKTTILN